MLGLQSLFVAGCVTLLRSWRGEEPLRQAAAEALAALRTHLATLLIAGATLMAGGILAIVALHMISE